MCTLYSTFVFYRTPCFQHLFFYRKPCICNFCCSKHTVFDGKLTTVSVEVNMSTDWRIHNSNWIEIDRKIDVTAKIFLLVQNRQQTHDWTLIGSGANGLDIQECTLYSKFLFYNTPSFYKIYFYRIQHFYSCRILLLKGHTVNSSFLQATNIFASNIFFK